MNINIKRKRKMGVTLSLALAAIIAIAATFAWLTAYDYAKNHLDTAYMDDEIVQIDEDFFPPDAWKPGQEVTKRVSVVNNGEMDMLVRVSFEEIMENLRIPAVVNDAPIETTSGSAVAGSINVPQPFNPGAYTSPEWDTLSKQGLTASGLPSGVEVLAKKEVSNPGTPQEKIHWSFVAYHPITAGPYSGQNQKVTFDGTVSGSALTATFVKFWGYTGMDHSEAAWANFAKPQTQGTYTKVSRSAIDHPITDNLNMISITYTDRAATGGTTVPTGKWWYNEDDGFFYYIGKLTGGSSTPNLIESLKLDGNAGLEYSGMKFDLIVNMEAIQNSKEAIRSNDGGGWNLSNAALLTELDKYCE